ncbi:porin [Cupriavidus sp. AcVe19-6a]|uniref:porin n=1 Tax=Cupriavidus sp. AcVe19-6a TaxID=2821358 RepID=UPI001AE8BE32|nr:porin [Cupriavidus sp. AcVe19-6a]MBP0638806.1 porin [Cupriavidus sp. AcVe19-6a]
MKLGHLALSCAAACPVFAHAQAQASVTLYGVVDTGVEYVNHVGAGQDSVTRMPSLTGTVPSRWGLRGAEDLGGGLKAQFALESGFAPDSGTATLGGRLFGRQAWVGLSGNWGQVAFGRQYTMMFWSTLDSDILGPNTFGSGSLDPTIPNSRADNAVSYKGKFGGLTIGATYSFGRDTVGAPLSPSSTNCAGENPADSRACREWSAMLMYETPHFGVSAAYDSARGGPGAFGGLTNSSLADNRLALSGYALFDRIKAGAGWLRHDNDGSPTPRSDLYWLGALYDITPAFTVASQVYHLRYHHSDNKAWLYALRGTYSFSTRTAIYATAGFIDNGGQLAMSVSSNPGATASPGGTQLGAMVGVKHVF